METENERYAIVKLYQDYYGDAFLRSLGSEKHVETLVVA